MNDVLDIHRPIKWSIFQRQQKYMSEYENGWDREDKYKELRIIRMEGGNSKLFRVSELNSTKFSESLGYLVCANPFLMR